MLCRCGCGQEFKPSQKTLQRLRQGNAVGYIQGHQHRGNRNVNWHGGKSWSRGYVYVLAPDHPKATKQGRVLEHRLVMERHLGRYLEDNEIPHHVNGNRSDNRIENLVLLTESSHKSLHWKAKDNPKAKRPAKGEENPTTHLTAREVLAIRAAAAKGTSLQSLADKYRMTYGGIWRIVRRYNWKHV